MTAIAEQIQSNPDLFRQGRFLSHLTRTPLPFVRKLSAFDLVRLYPDVHPDHITRYLRAGVPASVKELTAIVTRPVLTIDNDLLATEGHDVHTGLFLDFNGVVYPKTMTVERAHYNIDQSIPNLYRTRVEYKPQILSAVLSLTCVNLYWGVPPASVFFKNREGFTSNQLQTLVTGCMAGRNPVFIISCLTLMKEYRNLSCPKHDYSQLKTEWCDIVRGCVAWATNSDCLDGAPDPIKGIHVYGQPFFTHGS